MFYIKNTQEIHPFSNHYPCEVRIGDLKFDSVAAALADMEENMEMNEDEREMLVPVVLVQLLLSKFSLHEDLREALLETKDQDILFVSPDGDTYMGVNEEKEGRNVLGKCLVVTRDVVRKALNKNVEGIIRLGDSPLKVRFSMWNLSEQRPNLESDFETDTE